MYARTHIDTHTHTVQPNTEMKTIRNDNTPIQTQI